MNSYDFFFPSNIAHNNRSYCTQFNFTKTHSKRGWKLGLISSQKIKIILKTCEKAGE
jgi:hypothetical protein